MFLCALCAFAVEEAFWWTFRRIDLFDAVCYNLAVKSRDGEVKRIDGELV
jgi:hypothetical protein